jgi:hypothetical protein
MRQMRHKSTQVALAYLRIADLLRNNVTRASLRKKNERRSTPPSHAQRLA